MGRYSNVVQALIERINSHLATDGLLEGFKFADTPIDDPEGQSDFPVLRLWLPDMTELAHGRNFVDGTMGLKLTVSTSKAAGVVDFVEHVELVLDALELNDQGEKDLSMGGTLARPLTATVRDCFALGLSLNAHVHLSVLPKPKARGARRI